jgi:hypothetical protein
MTNVNARGSSFLPVTLTLVNKELSTQRLLNRSSLISSASMTSLSKLSGSSSPLYPGPQRKTRARSLPVSQIHKQSMYAASITIDQ